MGVLETVQTFGFLVAVTDRASSRATGAPAGWGRTRPECHLHSPQFSALQLGQLWGSCGAPEAPGPRLVPPPRRPARVVRGPAGVRQLAVGVRYLSCATVTRRRRRLAGEHSGLGGGGEPEAGHDLVHGDGVGGCVELGQGRHVP